MMGLTHWEKFIPVCENFETELMLSIQNHRGKMSQLLTTGKNYTRKEV